MKAFDLIKSPILPTQLDPLLLESTSAVELTQGIISDVILQQLEASLLELDQVTFERVELSSARIKNTYFSNVIL